MHFADTVTSRHRQLLNVCLLTHIQQLNIEHVTGTREQHVIRTDTAGGSVVADFTAENTSATDTVAQCALMLRRPQAGRAARQTTVLTILATVAF